MTTSTPTPLVPATESRVLDDTPSGIGSPEVAVRESELSVSVGEGITSASFALDPSSFAVTAGQPTGEPPVFATYLRSKGELLVRVFAGRSNSRAVADLFNSRTRDRAATRRAEATGGPSELNFTFTGTLILNGDQFPNVNIGQGSKSPSLGTSVNNWWIGVPSGETAAAKGDAFLCLQGLRERYQVTLPGGESFKISVRILGEGEVCGT